MLISLRDDLHVDCSSYTLATRDYQNLVFEKEHSECSNFGNPASEQIAERKKKKRKW